MIPSEESLLGEKEKTQTTSLKEVGIARKMWRLWSGGLGV